MTTTAQTFVAYDPKTGYVYGAGCTAVAAVNDSADWLEDQGSPAGVRTAIGDAALAQRCAAWSGFEGRPNRQMSTTEHLRRFAAGFRGHLRADITDGTATVSR